MQKILNKYPWISYKIDLSKMPHSFWFDLGQCVSKCEHIRQIPLLPEVGKRLHLIYLAKGVAATTAIEGNTLGEQKALEIIEGKAEIKDTEKYQKREIENILEACNSIAQGIGKGDSVDINEELLCNFNKIILSGGVSVTEGAVPGELRKHSIVVGNVYRGPDAQDVPFLLNKFCEWINNLGGELEEKNINKQSLAIIKAITAHLYLIWIHPFGDGNGRLARLIEFAILLQSGISSVAAHLLSNHYNSTRALYYKKLRQIKIENSVSSFFEYAVKGFQDNLKEVINILINQIIHISWLQYVYEKFRETPHKRRRDLLVEISKKYYEKGEVLSLDEIWKVAAPVYVTSGKTQKSFTRDFNALIKSDYIEKIDAKYKPKIGPILQRLPFSK